MREYRGYYEVTADFHQALDLKIWAGVCNLMAQRPHWHSGVEVLCQMRGCVTVEIEQTSYALGPGDVLVIDSLLAHRYRDGEASGLQLQVLLDEELLHRDDDRRLWLSTLGGLDKNDPEIAALRNGCGRLAELCAPLRQKEDSFVPDSQLWHLARAETHALIALLLRHTIPAKRTDRRVPPEFIRCVRFIQAHHCESLTAEDIAAACGYSRRTVFRLFQSYMGIPLREYLSFLRMRTAFGLLQRGDLGVPAIAAAVGLSESQFYRIFQKYVGLTPSDWQRATPADGQLMLDFDAGAEEIPDWDWLTGRKPRAF